MLRSLADHELGGAHDMLLPGFTGICGTSVEVTTDYD